MTPQKETYPLVKEMMGEYYKHHYIMGSLIYKKAGVSFAVTELGIGNVCLNYMPGKCTLNGCKNMRAHPKAAEATTE